MKKERKEMDLMQIRLTSQGGGRGVLTIYSPLPETLFFLTFPSNI